VEILAKVNSAKIDYGYAHYFSKNNALETSIPLSKRALNIQTNSSEVNNFLVDFLQEVELLQPAR
jgi:hypothetical protein